MKMENLNVTNAIMNDKLLKIFNNYFGIYIYIYIFVS